MYGWNLLDNLLIINNILSTKGLTVDDLSLVVDNLYSKTSFADLYLQLASEENFLLENGVLKSADFDLNQGVGLRTVKEDKASLAYTEELNLESMQQAAKLLKNANKEIIFQQGGAGNYDKVNTHSLYTKDSPLADLTAEQKVSLLKLVYRELSKDSKLVHSAVSLSGSYEYIVILNTEGKLALDLRPLVRLDVRVVLQAKNGKRGSGSSGGGGRLGYSYFAENNNQIAIQYAANALRRANLELEAIEAPAGEMDVVLAAGWPGVLLHEAVGHGLEGDFNRKGTSAFSNRVGEKVASDMCTVVDDGTMANRRGSLNVDDEGCNTQRTVLIENGILKGYMQDKMNAKLMHTTSTGNGRRESYAYLPMPRMTNTFMLPGKYKAAEIIASVKRGLYAVNFSGGSVDITSGKFVFTANEAYLIEDGKIGRPVKGATLIGNGPDVMSRITMVADDLALDSGVGVCGKDGQSVPVGVGQPTLKVEKLTVGGTQC